MSAEREKTVVSPPDGELPGANNPPPVARQSLSDSPSGLTETRNMVDTYALALGFTENNKFVPFGDI